MISNCPRRPLPHPLLPGRYLGRHRVCPTTASPFLRPNPSRDTRRRSVFNNNTPAAAPPARRWLSHGLLPLALISVAAVTAIANYPALPSGEPQFWNWLVRTRHNHNHNDDDEQPYVIYRGQRFRWNDAAAHHSTTDPSNPHHTGTTTTALPSKPAGDATTTDSLADKVTSLIVPDWARLIPAYITKLQNELSVAPGSLAEEMWQDAHDPEIHPEIVADASVRISDDLSAEESAFLRKRKQVVRTALAKYLGLNENDIHPDDVPVIAMCGSGGGLRALVAGSSSYLCASEDGLFDCLTYTAGVSGSCWLQTLYYSSLTAQSHRRLIDHLKSRLGVHIADPAAAMPLLTSAPTNKYILSGVFEKAKGTDGDFGIVDLYGLLLGARLLVPKYELSIDDRDLKISNQRQYLDEGQNPLPIYTAVRHEIPPDTADDDVKAKKAENAPKTPWFQWFEFTPYEFWCEELMAGIPTWAVGRHFQHGRSVPRENGLYLPEQRVPFLMGIWGSAFCATLSHYYAEVRPILKGITGLSSLDSLISDRHDDLSKLHPIQPARFPNFAQGLKQQLPSSVSDGLNEADSIELMDAGMSNNLPIYPLLRPGRDVDIIIAFDTSADVKTDNWLSVVDGYARQRGIKGWPIGAGWPRVETPASSPSNVASLEKADADTATEASAKLEKAKQADSGPGEKPDEQALTTGVPKSELIEKTLSYCNIWIGSTQERVAGSTDSADDRDPSKLVEQDWELMSPGAGICVIYFPFLPNKDAKSEAASKADPKSTDFMSTWNFVYTPDQIDTVVDLARANFDQGRDRTRRAVRAVYERKKKHRLEREALSRQEMMRAFFSHPEVHAPDMETKQLPCLS